MKQLYQFLKSQTPQFFKDSDTRVILNGKKMDYCDESTISKVFTAEVILNNNLIEFHNLPSDQKMELLKNTIEHNFRQDLVAKREKLAAVDKLIQDNGADQPSVDSVLKTLIPARYLGSEKKEGGFCFIDKETKKITEYDYWTILFSLCSELEEKEAKKFIHRFITIKPTYSPLDDYRMRKMDGTNNIYEHNTYVPPVWREEKVDPVCPPEIEQLMTHLFPKEESKEFVYTWMYHSISSRAQTYLYLCGGQGSGKNTLAKLLTELHGFHNSTLIKEGAIQGRFNDFLENKRFVFLDEFSSRNKKGKDTLKSIINDRIQIEGKGKKHVDISIHASYMIANNEMSAIGLDPIDRRFSVPDITDQNILEVLPEEWVVDIHEKLQDPAYIASFAAWLLETYKKPKWSPIQPYQKERFENIVKVTARVGLVDSLDKILRKEQPDYIYEDEKSEYQRMHKGQRYPSLYEWQNFFKSVKEGGEPLGVVDGGTFIPNSDYQPEEYTGGDLN